MIRDYHQAFLMGIHLGYNGNFMGYNGDILWNIYIYSVYGILYKNQLDMFLGVQLKIGGTHKMFFFCGKHEVKPRDFLTMGYCTS